MISNITKLKIGCKLGIQAAIIIVYVDDIVLLAPTIKELQSILNEAIMEAIAVHLEFNISKKEMVR